MEVGADYLFIKQKFIYLIEINKVNNKYDANFIHSIGVQDLTYFLRRLIMKIIKNIIWLPNKMTMIWWQLDYKDSKYYMKYSSHIYENTRSEVIHRLHLNCIICHQASNHKKMSSYSLMCLLFFFLHTTESRCYALPNKCYKNEACKVISQ